MAVVTAAVVGAVAVAAEVTARVSRSVKRFDGGLTMSPPFFLPLRGAMSQNFAEHRHSIRLYTPFGRG